MPQQPMTPTCRKSSAIINKVCICHFSSRFNHKMLIYGLLSVAVCIHNGTVYRSGSAMSTSSLCSYCYCIGGRQKCVKPKCLLPTDGCEPILIDTSCCPIRYDCSGNGTIKAQYRFKQHRRRNENLHYLRMTSRMQRSRGMFGINRRMCWILFFHWNRRLSGGLIVLSRRTQAASESNESMRDMLLHWRQQKVHTEKVRTSHTELPTHHSRGTMLSVQLRLRLVLHM